ncbi:MAG: hypothetical protein AAFX44_05310 [Pseudomonadota bacterium]
MYAFLCSRIVPMIAFALAALSAATTTVAQTATDDAFDAPRVMLYASKGFGASSDYRAAPKFGLRLDQPISGRLTGWRADPGQFRYMPMFDLRLARGHGTTFRMANMPLYGGAAYSADSSTEESWRNGWFWAGVGGGLLLVSCLSDNWPCEDDDDDDFVSPGLE